jgi:hypothetical protein
MGREVMRRIDRICDGKGENGAKESAHGPIRDKTVLLPSPTQIPGNAAPNRLGT